MSEEYLTLIGAHLNDVREKILKNRGNSSDDSDLEFVYLVENTINDLRALLTACTDKRAALLVAQSVSQLVAFAHAAGSSATGMTSEKLRDLIDFYESVKGQFRAKALVSAKKEKWEFLKPVIYEAVKEFLRSKTRRPSVRSVAQSQHIIDAINSAIDDARRNGRPTPSQFPSDSFIWERVNEAMTSSANGR